MRSTEKATMRMNKRMIQERTKKQNHDYQSNVSICWKINPTVKGPFHSHLVLCRHLVFLELKLNSLLHGLWYADLHWTDLTFESYYLINEHQL